MKCYQYIGGQVARIMCKDYLFWGVPMAPTFYMLAKGDRPTLEDFAREDKRLQKRLEKFADENQINWPDDEVWCWIDSVDSIQPICEGGLDKDVTRENYQDFREALLDKLCNESAEQMKFYKKGVAHILGDMHYMLKYLNWHDMMMQAETDKWKKYDAYELIQTCTESDAENEQVKRFWNVYKALNHEDKKLFWQFVTGGTRIPDIEHRWKTKLVIKIDETKAADSKPTSRPDHWEITFAANYETEEKLKEKLLEALCEGPIDDM